MDPVVEYGFEFPFESSFEFERARVWGEARMVSVVWISFFYVAAVLLLRRFMEPRQPLSCKRALIFWNGGLALFSILGALRTWPELLHVLRHGGLFSSVCSTNYLTKIPVTAFWSWLFTLSKVVELGDTVFLLLRKRPVIFLHWYHHATVLIYTWWTVTTATSSGRWFSAINLAIHSLMYSYYWAAALGVRFPKALSITITSLQILQMVVGLFINAVAFFVIMGNIRPCGVTTSNIYLSTAMYLSYFWLFVMFFHRTYVSPSKKIKKS